jgi:hypothetical protein
MSYVPNGAANIAAIKEGLEETFDVQTLLFAADYAIRKACGQIVQMDALEGYEEIHEKLKEISGQVSDFREFLEVENIF